MNNAAYAINAFIKLDKLRSYETYIETMGLQSSVEQTLHVLTKEPESTTRCKQLRLAFCSMALPFAEPNNWVTLSEVRNVASGALNALIEACTSSSRCAPGWKALVIWSNTSLTSSASIMFFTAETSNVSSASCCSLFHCTHHSSSRR